jgi:RimJ/RimL family protein N-acetyltransferase
MALHLETDRLLLREFATADVDLLLELDSDPEVMRFISDGVPSTLGACQAFVDRVVAGYIEHPGLGFWIAELKPSREFVGWFHLRPDRESPETSEIGYRLCRGAWGRGLATEGSEGLIEKARRELGRTSLCGRAMAANRASVHVLEKLGLEFVCEYLEDRFPGADKCAVLYRGQR